MPGKKIVRDEGSVLCRIEDRKTELQTLSRVRDISHTGLERTNFVATYAFL